MSEYIKREDAINIMQCEQNRLPKNAIGAEYSHVKVLLYNIPAADVVEVVRCKDCKYRPYIVDPNKPAEGFNLDQEWGLQRCPYLVADGWYSIMPNDDWFCSRGERKDGESE